MERKLHRVTLAFMRLHVRDAYRGDMHTIPACRRPCIYELCIYELYIYEPCDGTAHGRRRKLQAYRLPMNEKTKLKRGKEKGEGRGAVESRFYSPLYVTLWVTSSYKSALDKQKTC